MTPETHAIICTMNAGGVAVFTPLIDLGWMARGGYWGKAPRGFLGEIVRRKSCPKLQKGRHISEAAAWRFVEAMQWGGLTTQEAWDVIREHDAERLGHDAQLIRLDELPGYWFRDAWTRERSNSGLPYVDLEKARRIQWTRIASAVARENKRRSLDLFGGRPIRVQRMQIERAIRNARDAEELRRIWPQSLSQRQ
jgi:hypothetical protein